MLKLIIVAVLAVAAYVAYKLFKSGKPVTISAVEAGVEQQAESVASSVEQDVTKS